MTLYLYYIIMLQEVTLSVLHTNLVIANFVSAAAAPSLFISLIGEGRLLVPLLQGIIL